MDITGVSGNQEDGPPVGQLDTRGELLTFLVSFKQGLQSAAVAVYAGQAGVSVEFGGG